MTIVEMLTLIALILGPVSAVAISLWIDGRRKRRDQRLIIVRALLTTRHIVGDPTYSAAINLIPVEFSDNWAVMDAYRAYIEAVRFQPSPDNQEAAVAQTVAKQTRLIFEVTKAMGFRIAETDLQTTAYAADGWIRREMVRIDSEKAMRDIASILAIQTKLLAQTPANPAEQQFIEDKAPKPDA